MVLTNLILGAVLVLMLGAIVSRLIRGFQTYLRYRGQRVLTCPDTHQPAAVHVDALKAARVAVAGKQRIKVEECSRWPEGRNCGQECLSQIQADPESCLVGNMVAAWYRGKSWAYCRKPFAEIHWHDRYPALLSPERVAKQWKEMPAEKLPEVFQTHLAVCWNCYIAETFRRRNADRVLDRNWERGAGGEYVQRDEPTEPLKSVTRP